MTAAILGAGEASRVPAAGRTAMDLAVEASFTALDDAGLDLVDIDGVVAGYSLVEPRLDFSADLAEALGVRPRWSRMVSRSGATGAAAVVTAVHAVLSGACRTALAVWADNRVSAAASDVTGTLAGGLSVYEAATGPLIATQYALLARSYLERWKATPEDLAGVCVQFRRHAALNPGAKHRRPLTVQDVLASPMASDPLHVFECALVTDYGGAVVVRRADDVPPGAEPVVVRGFGEALTHQSILRCPELFETGRSAAADSAAEAFHMAGMRPADVQMAQIYDCFSITVLLLLEDFGFVPRGQAGVAVREGLLDRAGSFPANTNGGMLSCGGGGILHVTEAVRQMRGNAGEHQLARRPETALVHGNGGIIGSQTTMLLAQA